MWRSISDLPEGSSPDPAESQFILAGYSWQYSAFYENLDGLLLITRLIDKFREASTHQRKLEEISTLHLLVMTQILPMSVLMKS